RLPEGRSLRSQLALLQRDLKRVAPREPYIVINTHASKLSLRTADSVLFEAVCSAGSGAELTDSTTGRRWVFDTPRGMYKVTSKIKDPWWRKPDWAFVEENEPVPEDENERLDPRMMGEYAIGFGDGYFIHGTIYERLLGVNVTHGCVRLGAEDLRYLYKKVPIGTRIYVF
ncbi:MAG TPA: L,D-transpeptidase, partial [candidate division Zixibacteria bacterium]|nr:L,D-transpeptidase [candidate division Zixibacteria bacterium]